MEIIDLKKAVSFIDQYIELRNSYMHLLLTSPVNKQETIQWLRELDIEVIGLIEGPNLLGVGILYCSRKGEIAFFVKEQNKGLGSKLLALLEEAAIMNNLDSIWAWTLSDNYIAQKTFEKCGFHNCGNFSKQYGGQTKNGIKFTKLLRKVSV